MDNTLSIVPSDGTSNEFPVLKAFQEYIDAEQAKARKRMLGLSVFFIVLLIVVVVTFVLVLTTVINRNQALSDKLLDYALKERDRSAPVVQQVPVQPQPVQQKFDPQEILKPLIERLEREREEMKSAYERQQKEAAQKAAANEAARAEELNRVKAELEKERARTKKENDRQEQIERQRRRLYPEYYRMESEPAVQPQASRTPVVAPSNPAPVQPRRTAPPQAKPQQKPQQPKPSAPASVQSGKSVPSLSTIKPVTYFNTDDDDGVPFIIETPKQNTK